MINARQRQDCHPGSAELPPPIQRNTLNLLASLLCHTLAERREPTASITKRIVRTLMEEIAVDTDAEAG